MRTSNETAARGRRPQDAGCIDRAVSDASAKACGTFESSTSLECFRVVLRTSRRRSAHPLGPSKRRLRCFPSTFFSITIASLDLQAWWRWTEAEIRPLTLPNPIPLKSIQVTMSDGMNSKSVFHIPNIPLLSVREQRRELRRPGGGASRSPCQGWRIVSLNLLSLLITFSLPTG